MTSWISVVFTLAVPFSAQASFTVRSGGDAVVCQSVPGAVHKGFKALDFLVTYDSSGSPLTPVRSWNDSAARLLKLFRGKLPEMAMSFEVFAANYLNRDPSRTHLWEPAEFGLKTLDDKGLIGLLPENCTFLKNSVRVARTVQAIVRQPSEFTGRPPARPTYAYVPKVLAALEKSDPLQLSFLIVHEWLWDFSMNVDRNRRINRFLHSEQFERLSRDQVLAHLRGFGFVPPAQANGALFSESCLPEPGEIGGLFAIPRGQSRLLIHPEPFAHRLNCLRAGASFRPHAQGGAGAGANDCAPTSVGPVDAFARQFHRKRAFELRSDGQLRLVSFLNERKFEHLDCLVDMATARLKCGPLIDVRGKESFAGAYAPRLEFSGTMNRSCIRVAASGALRTPLRPDFWTEDSFVIFLRLAH